MAVVDARSDCEMLCRSDPDWGGCAKSLLLLAIFSAVENSSLLPLSLEEKTEDVRRRR